MLSEKNSMLNTTVNIRRAVKEDCGRLLELVQELAEYERAPNEVTVTLEHFQESGFGKSPVWWAFVAEVDGKIVGFALYYIRYSTWKGQRMYLEDILVTNEMRGKGIGKLLTQECIRKTKEKHLGQLIIHTTQYMRNAWEMYERMGFKRSEDLDFMQGALPVFGFRLLIE